MRRQPMRAPVRLFVAPMPVEGGFAGGNVVPETDSAIRI